MCERGEDRKRSAKAGALQVHEHILDMDLLSFLQFEFAESEPSKQQFIAWFCWKFAWSGPYGLGTLTALKDSIRARILANLEARPSRTPVPLPSL